DDVVIDRRADLLDAAREQDVARDELRLERMHRIDVAGYSTPDDDRLRIFDRLQAQQRGRVELRCDRQLDTMTERTHARTSRRTSMAASMSDSPITSGGSSRRTRSPAVATSRPRSSAAAATGAAAVFSAMPHMRP